VVGTHSKTTLKIDPTFLPLLTETPFVFALFSYMARQLTPHLHATLEAGREMPVVPLAVAALTPTRARPKALPSLISLSLFLLCWHTSVVVAAAATWSPRPLGPLPPTAPPLTARPHRRRNVAEDAVFQLECVEKARTRWRLTCGCKAAAAW
jgi:hypothetical protein